MQVAADILIVEDDPEMRDLLSRSLASAGHSATAVDDGEEALKKIKNQKFRLLICDLALPKLSGIDVLKAAKKQYPDTEVIIITAHATVAKAVSAIKHGAYDFIQKPFFSQEFLTTVERALEKNELKADMAVYESSLAVFQSTKLENLLPVIIKLALKLLEADDISIMLTRDGCLEVVASHGTRADERKHFRVPLGGRVAGKVAQAREPIIINGPLQKDPRFSGVSSFRPIHASIVYPLIMNGEVIGILTANRTVRTEPFFPSDLHGAAIFASHIAQAIYNANLYEKLELKIFELESAHKKLKETQAQLTQSKKLAAIGQLAAGVAHELNNPLTAVMGFCQLLLLDDSLPKQHREDLDCIQTQSQRCRRIIQDLLQFSRRSEAQKERVDLHAFIEEVMKLVQQELSRDGIAVTREIDKHMPPISADQSQMQQVFLNLINNARHAMSGRPEPKLAIKAHCSGDKILISFSDNGCGIPQKHIDKVFDPFFTTKPVGQGTGLGLSVSYGIIQDHGGTIRAESQEGAGSVFTIELPAGPPTDSSSAI